MLTIRKEWDILGLFQLNGGNKMTNEEIIHYFDTHWNVTLAELARISGRSVKELKKILMT